MNLSLNFIFQKRGTIIIQLLNNDVSWQYYLPAFLNEITTSDLKRWPKITHQFGIESGTHYIRRVHIIVPEKSGTRDQALKKDNFLNEAA